MQISDKTRKVLWGRSGNRCVLCRRELIVEALETDDESVVGEECHIVSARPAGPRYDPLFPQGIINELENLILLCRVHHKMVDDQTQNYSVEKLQGMKSKHELWVSQMLSDTSHWPNVRLHRKKGNTPSHLAEITSGKELFDIIDGSLAFQFDHDDPNDETEVEILGSFFQEMQDWGDISSDFEAGYKVEARYRVGGLLTEIQNAGFRVFGGKEIQVLEGGVNPPSPFPVAILKVVRKDNPEITKVSYS